MKNTGDIQISQTIFRLRNQVHLLLPSGKKIKRPLKYVYPLERDVGHVNELQEEHHEINENQRKCETINDDSEKRSERVSAIIARQ